MALKPNRVEHLTDISYFMNQEAERGIVVVHKTDSSGVGAAMDDANATVALPTGLGSGQLPAGLLLNDMVNIDLTRQQYNAHRDEMQVGGKCTLLRRGTVVTNMTSGSFTSVGQDLHFVNGGLLVAAGSSAVSPKVGRVLSLPDSDGFLKVEINIV